MALFLALLFSSYSNSQTVDPATGNLINTGSTPTDTTSTWNNGMYVDQLCFGWGDPGNCGPNPSIRPGGVINFSYGTVDLNQIVNINKALSISGSGVQLSGFNFGFTAKNGNGWDDGRQDYLGAYVKFYNSTGGLASAYDYTSYTNNRYNWSQFYFSETFASPVSASSYSNAQVGFIGRDNNGWAGNYGPEIYNVNFSLKYSVKPDPCIADPLSSPTCPGYALATVKNSILGSTVAGASVTSYIPTITSTSTAPAITDSAPALSQTSPLQPPPPPPPPPQDSNPTVQDSPTQPSPQQAGPAPTGPQPAGGPVQTTSTSAPAPISSPQQAGPQQGSGSGPSKLAMSVVKSVQAKEQAIQQMAVQTSTKAFESAMQNSQTASNSAITMNQDMSANSAAAAAQFSSQTTQSSMQMFGQTQQVNNSGQTYNGTGLSVARANTSAFNIQSLNSSTTGQISGQSSSIIQFRNESKTFEVEQPTTLQVASFGKTGNPLSDLMNQQMAVPQTNIEQRPDSVKKNVQPNELAGGVDVAAMAQVPKGYEAYSVVTLRDAPFYKPEVIYKNNRTVDNANVFRGLTGGSDAKHQQMVDSQYKLGD